jgi:hypothetical protein
LHWSGGKPDCGYRSGIFFAVLKGVDMTATQFATELKVSGLRMVGNRIVSDDCPGIAWKPVKTRGQMD